MPASGKDLPGSLARDTLHETQMKRWVSRELQAALLDTTRLNALLTEAAQYRMSSMLLRVTGAGPALATAGGLELPRPCTPEEESTVATDVASADAGRAQVSEC